MTYVNVLASTSCYSKGVMTVMLLFHTRGFFRFPFLFPYNVPTVFRLEVGNPDLSSEPSRHLVAQHTLAQTLVRATVHLEGLAGVLRGDGWDAELDEEQPSRSRPRHPCVLTQREARGPLPGRESRARECCD